MRADSAVPAGPSGMMSHFLAGGQDYLGVIYGSDW